MSVEITPSTRIVDIPKVELTYTPNNYNKDVHLAFVGMRSNTTLQSLRQPTWSRSYSKTYFDGRLMRCKEFSFHGIIEKPQTVHGFRKGKIVESRTKQFTSDCFYEDICSKSDTKRQKTEDFSISGQKVTLKTGEHTNNVTPPREWIIEKSRTLPDIGDFINTPYPTPVKIFRPTKSKIKDKLIINTESLVSIEKVGKDAEPRSFISGMVQNTPRTDSMKEDSGILPSINDAVDQNTSLKAVTVSLQTDDYLYYGTNNDCRPTTSQQSRPVRYKPLKTLTPKTSKKLPHLYEKSLTSRDTQKQSRKTFPTFRVPHNSAYENVVREASKNPLQNLSSSLPLLSHQKIQ